MVLPPAGASLFSAGALFLSLAGAAGLAAIYTRGLGGRRNLSNPVKMTLGVLAFFLMFFGVVFTLLSLAGAFNWPESGRQTAGFALAVAAGALCQLLLMSGQTEPAQEGFYVSGEKCVPRWGPSGLRYVYEGDRNGIPLKVSVTVGSADRRGAPRYVVKVVCLVDNPHEVELLAHVDKLSSRPLLSRLPKIRYVPHWRGYVVRGSPARLIADTLSPFRRATVTIFS